MILLLYCVTCSAGVGRSGAFCAISTAIERVKAEGTVDIFHGVKHLRTQRPHMVQTMVRIDNIITLKNYYHYALFICTGAIYILLQCSIGVC